VCVNTAACLFAGRFGLAPTVNKNYTGSGASRPYARKLSTHPRRSVSLSPILVGNVRPALTHTRRNADSYTMTEAERPVVGSRDPAGFTIVDVAAWGSLAHMISAGEILGQHAKGFF
jgi:photosystem I subunit 10